MTSVVYSRGPSAHTGEPLMVCAVDGSSNVKTASIDPRARERNAVQLYVLSEVDEPQVLRSCGLDRGTCGDCPLRAGNGCYVQCERGPRVVWENCIGRPAEPGRVLDTVRGRTVRAFAYGGGSAWARPLELIALLETARRTGGKVKGYEHGWRESRNQWMRHYCCASVHGRDDATLARAMGWVPFRTAHLGDEAPSACELLCPGGGCVGCDGCDLETCDGIGRVVLTHGARRNYVAEEVCHENY